MCRAAERGLPGWPGRGGGVGQWCREGGTCGALWPGSCMFCETISTLILSLLWVVVCSVVSACTGSATAASRRPPATGRRGVRSPMAPGPIFTKDEHMALFYVCFS